MSEAETTNPVADEELQTAPVEGVEEDGQDDGLENLDEDGNPEGTDDEETEEVDHEGQKYKIPKALKPALLMQADYTRKTQDLAEQRKAFEAERTQHVTADAEVLNTRAQLIALDNQIAAFKEVNWQALEAQDAQQGTTTAATLWRQLSQLKDARAEADGQLREKETARTLDQQRARARQIEEGQAVLARDIKGWGPELAGKLASFAEKDFGVTRQELAKIDDPRLIKMLHRAFQNTQAQTGKQAVARIQVAETVKPTPKVGGGAPAPKGLDDRLSTDEWLRRRNAQLAKRT